MILTGSVRPAADAVKVSLELLNPADDTTIWSGQYTRPAKDIFAVQAQVAEEVASALRLKLLPTPSSARAASRTVDPRGYELYVRGRQATAERRLPEAIALYEQAIAADAGLAEAFAGLAETLHLQEVFLGQPLDPEREQKLRSAAERAYQLDPDLPQANLTMGLAATSFTDMLGYMRRAIEADPSDGEAYHEIGDHVGAFDPERAIAFFRKSLEVDPAIEIGHVDIAAMFWYLHRWDEARNEARLVHGAATASVAARALALTEIGQHGASASLRTLDADPNIRSTDSGWAEYVMALQTVHRTDDASREAAQALKRFPDSCLIRSLSAGLRLEHGDIVASRRLADSVIAPSSGDDVSAVTMRCAVIAAAATRNARLLASLVDRLAARESWLRHWAQTTGIRMRIRLYPFGDVMGDPVVAAAVQRLDAAYGRQREIAASVLATLP